MGRSRKSLDDQTTQDLSGKQAVALLKRAGLPSNYPDLSARQQQQVRLKVLHGWFDRSKPQILCTNVGSYIQAHFLFTEFYVKPAAINQGIYFFDDPKCKYDMLRAMLAPPRIPSEPSKAIIKAARGLSKTQTCCVEAPTLIGITRPFTGMLLTELNAKRTSEEIRKIKIQVEQNERIEQDFGGAGVLYPKGSRDGEWSTLCLTFKNNPRTYIMGHSLGSAQRGRRPLLEIWDDVESEETTYNRDWRRQLIEQMFGVYLPMLTTGGHFTMIGTPIHKSAVLELAFRGMSDDDTMDGDAGVDARFRDFTRVKFPMVYRDKEGRWQSQQSQRLSVEGFERRKQVQGMASVSAELQCDPMTPGQRAFAFDAFRHGWMHCKHPDTGTEYMLDLLTQTTRPWDEFMKEIRVVGAGDLADGQSADSDQGALIWHGVDAHGIIFALDCYVKRCMAEDLIESAYRISEEWDCETFGWEKAAMLVVVNRIAKRLVEKLRAEGKTPPVFRELENARKNKVRRILTMSPKFTQNIIRFRHFDAVRLQDGTVHYPAPYNRQDSYQVLIDQILEMTDEGIRGPDDAVDVCEMGCRLAEGVRGELAQILNPDNPMEVLKMWNKAGLTMTVAQIPLKNWTEEMMVKHEKEMLSPVRSAGGYIPYV